MGKSLRKQFLLLIATLALSCSGDSNDVSPVFEAVASISSQQTSYEESSGDVKVSVSLDETNSTERSITLTTAQGQETFSYFYVITEEFPQIGRCLAGTPDDSFK